MELLIQCITTVSFMFDFILIQNGIRHPMHYNCVIYVRLYSNTKWNWSSNTLQLCHLCSTLFKYKMELVIQCITTVSFMFDFIIIQNGIGHPMHYSCVIYVRPYSNTKWNWSSNALQLCHLRSSYDTECGLLNVWTGIYVLSTCDSSVFLFPFVRSLQ